MLFCDERVGVYFTAQRSWYGCFPFLLDFSVESAWLQPRNIATPYILVGRFDTTIFRSVPYNDVYIQW